MIKITKRSYFVESPGSWTRPGVAVFKHWPKYCLYERGIKNIDKHGREFEASNHAVAKQIAEMMMAKMPVGAKYGLVQWVSWSGWGIPNGAFWNYLMDLEVVEDEK